MTKVGAGAGRGQDMRQEDPLVQLVDGILGLIQLTLGRDLLGGRKEAGKLVGGGEDQLLHPDLLTVAVGERLVDLVRVAADEGLPHEPLLEPVATATRELGAILGEGPSQSDPAPDAHRKE